MTCRRALVPLTIAFALTLGACSASPSTPEVTPAPTAESTTTSTPTPTPTPTAVAEPDGTRDAPLELGQSRKVSDVSAWIVSLTGTTADGISQGQAAAEGESFVVGTFHIAIDGPALEAQEGGDDIANDGLDVRGSLRFEYVSVAGKSYDSTSGTACRTGNDLYQLGAVYSLDATIDGDECIAVPTAEVPGGLWRVSNMANESVWFVGN